MCHTPHRFVQHLYGIVCARILFRYFNASDSKSRQFSEHQLSHGVTAAVMAPSYTPMLLCYAKTYHQLHEQFVKSRHPTSATPFQTISFRFHSLPCCVSAYFKYEINRDNVRIRIINIFTLGDLPSIAC